MFYNYFRDYDPATGRYVQSDPIGLDGGLNTYGYVGGRPMKYIDPLGLAVMSECEKRLRLCRLNCKPSLNPWALNSVGKTSACLTKCEEKYGGLSNCGENQACVATSSGGWDETT